jgi:hypothetical protein
MTPNYGDEKPEKAVNGTSSDLHDKWCTGYGYGTNQWLEVDLGAYFYINKWVVINSSAVYKYNLSLYTRNYRLQYKDDYGNWIDADTVINNTNSWTSRMTNRFKARYVRLYVDLGDVDNCVRIHEFQLYDIESPDTCQYIGNELRIMNRMYLDQYLVSPNGKYKAIYQADGNFVTYRMSDYMPIWHTNTWGRVNTAPNMSYLEYQLDDGNFAMYYYEQSTGMYVCPWATNTFNIDGRRVVLQDDGNLVMLNSNNQVLWSSF